MINIGLCFYGEFREWEFGRRTIDVFKSLPEERYNVDVFVHTWSNITRKYTNNSHLDKIIALENKKNTPVYDIEEKIKAVSIKEKNITALKINEIYNPIQLKVESKNKIVPYLFKHKAIHGNWPYENLFKAKYTNNPGFCQFYSTYKSYNLLYDYCLQTNKNYDLIFILRTDVIIKKDNITAAAIDFYNNYFNNHYKDKKHLLIDRIIYKGSTGPGRKKSDMMFYHATLLSNTLGFNEIYKNFTETDLFMGKYPEESSGNTHVEWCKYIQQYTGIERVDGLSNGIKIHYITPKYKQYTAEVYSD